MGIRLDRGLCEARGFSCLASNERLQISWSEARRREECVVICGPGYFPFRFSRSRLNRARSRRLGNRERVLEIGFRKNSWVSKCELIEGVEAGER